MAKKAPVNAPAFSPIKSGLVHAVGNGRVSGKGIPIIHARRKVPDLLASQNNSGDKAHEAPHPGAAEKLTREKRVLISESEEITVNQLVHNLASSGASSLKLSHILRACLLVLRHCEAHLIDCLRNGRSIDRPPNNDLTAIESFEYQIARVVVAAVHRSQPLP
jgi:hypothetical protein